MSIITKLEQLSAKIDNDKTLLASAITNKGVGTASTESLSSMAAKIEQIEQGSGGSLEPGTRIPANKLELPQDTVVSSYGRWYPYSEIIGNKAYYISTYLYVRDLDTNKYSSYFSSFRSNSYGRRYDNTIVYVGCTSGSPYNYSLLFFDIETETEIKQIKLESTEAESNGKIIGEYGLDCYKIEKIGEDYYLLFSYFSNTKNFLIKVTPDEKITIKTLNSIDGTTGAYYNNMIADDKYLYIIQNKALICVDTNLSLVNKNTTISGSSSYIYYNSLLQDDNYIYAKTATNKLYYKISKETLKHQSVTLSVIENLKYMTRLNDNSIAMYSDKTLYVLNNNFGIMYMKQLVNDILNVGSYVKSDDGKTYIIVECTTGNIVHFDSELNLLWDIPYAKEINTAFFSSSYDSYLDSSTNFGFCYCYKNKIYLLRTNIISIDFDPVYTVK